MARPYSMDLREHIVSSIVKGGVPCRQAAERYGVTASTAIKWLQLLHRTGSAAAGQMSGHKPKRLTGTHRDWLIERCKTWGFTLRGPVRELADRGLKVDCRSV